MLFTLRNPLICIVGPTASGKTALAQSIAERLQGSVLSADSMQVYRGMDIGTGKIPEPERTVPYFGIDIADPGDAYSAQLFQLYGRKVVEGIDSAGGHCIVCGGTGFYVRALIDEFDFPKGEQVENPVREKWQNYLDVHGAGALWCILHETDPDSARAVHPNDHRRVIRALELHEQGLSYAGQKEAFPEVQPHYAPVCMIGLSVDVDVLNERINERVDEMLATGLVEEVRRLVDAGFGGALTSSQAIGYKELLDFLAGKCTLDQASELVKRRTRQYAKRQRTWFRKEERICWIDATNADGTQLLEQALKIVESCRA